jgi:quinol monooxygenase YgiN
MPSAAHARVVAVAEIHGISGRRDELVELLKRTEEQVRALPASRRYEFATRVAAPDEFVLISEWDSEEAMAAYHRSEPFASYQHELHGLLARPSEMTIYSVTETVRPVASGPPDPRDVD